MLCEKKYGEPPYTWRMSLIILMFHLVILMAGAVFIKLDIV